MQETPFPIQRSVERFVVPQERSSSRREQVAHVEVPFALPGLLWNTMMSMSGSWVFLVASEAFPVGKQNVMVSAESTPLENLQTSKTSKQVRYFKAKVLEDHTAEGVNRDVRESFDEKAIVFIDKSTSYVDIADYVEMHVTEKSTKESTAESLRWVHIFISNDKRNLLGDYHKVKGKYLHLYLNEFVYKLNRRYFREKLFNCIVIAGITGL